MRYILPFKITIFISILMRADAFIYKGRIGKINVRTSLFLAFCWQFVMGIVIEVVEGI